VKLRPFFRVLTPLALTAMSSLAHPLPSLAQDNAKPAEKSAERTQTPANSPTVCPTSTLETKSHAVTQGRDVDLNPDGTWSYIPISKDNPVEAISNTGETITLRESIGSNDKIIRCWAVEEKSGGPIQIVVTRAVETEHSAHSQRDNCIPIVTVRNLNPHSLSRIISEIQFSNADGIGSSASIMFGPLDQGEEQGKTSAPLFVPGCKGLRGTVHIAFCRLDDGARCDAIVTASEFGVIPLTMSPRH